MSDTKAMIEIISWVLLGIAVTMLILNHYFHYYRNHKTAAFKNRVLDMVSKTAQRRIMQGRDDWEEPYNLMNKHTYNSMVYSFKPFKFEAWFIAEEIEVLKEGGSEHGED